MVVRWICRAGSSIDPVSAFWRNTGHVGFLIETDSVARQCLTLASRHMQSSMGTLPNGEPIFALVPGSRPPYLHGVHELNTELKESEKKRREKALQITRLQEKLSQCEKELGEIEAHLQRVLIEGGAEKRPRLSWSFLSGILPAGCLHDDARLPQPGS